MAGDRVEVLHGVNLDQLGDRNPVIYGEFTLTDLELKIGDFAADLDLKTSFFQSNSEGEFVEQLHGLGERADAAIVNAGAWTHYSWAIRDALEMSGVPAVEVHISDVSKREKWRQVTVFEGLENLIGRIYGKGPDGY